jgi:hypothetical protein
VLEGGQLEVFIEGTMLRKNRFSALLLGLFLFSLSLQALAQKAAEIPPGTTIKVRMIDSLNSGKTQSGDTFHATLEQAIIVDGKEIYPKGADVTGRVADVKQSGRLSEPGELQLLLATIASGNRASSVQSEPLVIKGESHTKSNATKIGGGAALGAIIGAVAGGGKGAAIGTVAGGAAGTGAAAATGKREAVVESEAVLSFVTTQGSAASSSTNENAPHQSEAPPPSADGAHPTAGAAQNSANETQPGPQNSSPVALFTARDRRVIRNCVAEHTSDLPAGITQREELPSGNERQIRQGGTLPAELDKKIQDLPLECEKQLPELPGDLERVVFNGRVLLINDQTKHILDVFYLDETQ